MYLSYSTTYRKATADFSGRFVLQRAATRFLCLQWVAIRSGAIIGITATIKDSSREIPSFIAISTAIVATMLTTYVCLAYAEKLTQKIGPMGIDAATRIVGFFVSAIGVGLFFDGVVEALQMHGVTALH